MELGSQLYTFRNKLKSKEYIPATFEKLKEYGCTCAQISALCPIEPNELKKIADDNGLKLPATHSPFARITNDIDALAEEHLTLGAELIGLGMMPLKYQKGGVTAIKEFADKMNKASDRLKEYNLKLAYHNHSLEFKKVDKKIVFDYLLELMPDVDIIFDVFWARFAGYDPVEFMSKLDGRARLIHFKDYKKKFLIPRIVDVGDGELDFEKIIEKAQAIGTKYGVIEHDFTRDPFKTTERSMEHLKKFI